MLIDTHAHLDYEEFAADFDEVLARTRAAGVEKIITIGTSVESSRRAVELAEQHEMIYAVVGVHPTMTAAAPDDFAHSLRQLAAHPRVAAIGEIGLDYHRLPEDAATAEREKSKQAAVFAALLELAVATRLNVVIHQRDAWQDTVAALRPFTGKVKGVFHCFGGTRAQADEVLALGHYVSFTGIATFKNGANVREVAAAVPSDRFMVETDCPYLAPVPYRGKRCEPAYTRETAAVIAQVRGETLDGLADRTTANARSFFRLID
jgi:TatD DNase family protein